jgi:hypothetical protein
MKTKLLTICAVMLLVSGIVSAADVAGWNAFVIRNSTTGNIAPVITDDAGGGKVFAITLGGQKAGWGTNNMNGYAVGTMKSVSIARDPGVTGWGPYFNIWVKDSNGIYAVLANEPSNVGEWAPGTAYNITWAVLKNATAKVNEAGAGFALPRPVGPYTFNDFAGYTIATPPIHQGGTGAPDDLNAGTYTAYGFNWVFGDTQSNYVGGYLVSSPVVVPPIPFVDPFDTIDSAWVTDRADAAIFEVASFAGDNRLKHGVQPDSQANTWYAYQGKKRLTYSATTISADLFVPTPATPQQVSLSIWANGTDGTNDQLAWPVLGFRVLADGTKVWRIFDDDAGAWVPLTLVPAAYDTWYNLDITLANGKIEYAINGEVVFRDNVVDPSIIGFKEGILQAYNFGTVDGYYAYWDNFTAENKPAIRTITAMPTAGVLGVTADCVTGFEGGSWKATGPAKYERYFTPDQLFGRNNVKISELANLSYWTKKSTTHAVDTSDWYVVIYTKPYTGQPIAGKWYSHRIGSEPYFAQNMVDPANTWNKWVTGAGENNRLRFFESTGDVYFGSYTDGFLSDLVSNPTLKDKEILYIVVSTGSAWAATFDGQLDGLTVELSSGDSGKVNFEPLTWNVLKLNASEPSLYVKPGEKVIVDMDALNLAQEVFGCQAVLNFSSGYFYADQTGANAPVVVAGGGIWNELVYSTWYAGGDLDVAVGVNLTLGIGTQADGTVAKFALTAANNEGTTNMVFRANSGINETMFSDSAAQPIYPGSKIDSQMITIDGTAPVDVVITADPATWTKNSPVALTFSATDALSGIDHYELQLNGAAYFTATSPYAWNVSALATGTYTATVKAIDKAGNEATASTTVYIDTTNPVASFTATQNSANVKTGSASATTPVTIQGSVLITVTASDANAGLAAAPVTVAVAGVTTGAVSGSAGSYSCTATVDAATTNGAHQITITVTDMAGNVLTLTDWIFVDKNQATGQVELEGVGACSRAVTFVATGGTIKTWTQTLNFVGGIASYTLTNVPGGTTGLSAKTAWSLRNKLAVTMVDGQASANFTGAEKLLGGDLNGTNTINILDYSVLKANYFTANPVADINGNGVVNLIDYNILKANFFKAGDVE